MTSQYSVVCTSTATPRTTGHTLYQSVCSFAVYLLTLSAKARLNGNSGNKQSLGGGSIRAHVEFQVEIYSQTRTM